MYFTLAQELLVCTDLSIHITPKRIPRPVNSHGAWLRHMLVSWYNSTIIFKFENCIVSIEKWGGAPSY